MTMSILKLIITLIWQKNGEANDILFQLAFKEVMATDICHGREEMGLIKKILSVEKNL